MRVKLQLVLWDDASHEATVTDIVPGRKDARRIAPLGLTLWEAKQLRTPSQQRLLQHQVAAWLDGGCTWPDGGGLRKATGAQTRSCRPWCGPCTLFSPRLFHCGCRRHQTTSFRPLSALLTASAAPARLLMATKGASRGRTVCRWLPAPPFCRALCRLPSRRGGMIR